MILRKHYELPNFFVIGISYKKTDTTVRGRFSICEESYRAILSMAPAYGINAMFILSTCNRTEVFGFADRPEQLIDLICTQTKGDADEFTQQAYIKNGTEAIEHLFNVAAGLDSQILGDFEIISQLKKAVRFSKEHQFINGFLERLVNTVLQSSKMIKNDTGLSKGTTSVSFAAIEYIKENIGFTAGKKILLLGSGKFGQTTCKNLVHYLGTSDITIVNRTHEKAAELAAALCLKCAPIVDLAEQVEAADIILTATNAPHIIIYANQLKDKGNKLIIDLSIPANVEDSAALLPNIKLVNVDQLSKLNNNALEKREAEVSKAKEIIANHLNDFTAWHQNAKNAPVLKAISIKLSQIAMGNTTGIACEDQPIAMANNIKIQRLVNCTAGKMRIQNQAGCYYIQAITDFIFDKAQCPSNKQPIEVK